MRLTEHRRRRSEPCFLIQHESPGSDHYDLSLEIDGELVSWSIPADKRLARRAGNHPLKRAADDAAVSDSGTYANATPYDMTECLERGYLSFHLCGEKLRGCYTLTRIREGEEETWLLMKRKEDDWS
jgi:DNA ligase D-like protein (predicted 3'-phosphoesterase)